MAFQKSSGSKQIFSEVHHFKISKRTEGDDMEVKESTSSAEKVPLRDQLIYRPVDLKESFLKPTPVVGEMISLTPKITVDCKKCPTNVKIAKEPKFIPYEPYKAATKPIIQNKKTRLKLKDVASPNIEELLHLKKIHINESTKNELAKSKNHMNIEYCSVWNDEKQALLEEINVLKIENSDLKYQVEYQAQVNAEIRKLLVAAVGEDIETRVQLLAEDKLHLAKQLIKSANCLSTHQEQIEWLVGQSEVWRSKFLSSSMLVEDLAKWKAGLCQKLNQYEKSIRKLLEDNEKIRHDTCRAFVNLSILQEKFNLDVMPRDTEQESRQISMNIIELCAANSELSDLLYTQLLHDLNAKKKLEFDSSKCLTAAEHEAQMILSQPAVPYRLSDIACSAVMSGAALALSSVSPHCSQCNGKVQTV